MRRTRLVLLAVPLLALGFAVSALAQQPSTQQKAPAEYYQLLGRANYAFQHAQSKDDYAAAAKLFQQAADLAPWLPDTYYNLGLTQKSAEQFNDAIASLQHYLQLKPDAPDRDKVQETIEMLKGEAQQATQQPAQTQPAPATQEQSDADFIRSLDGVEYQTTGTQPSGDHCVYSARINGSSLSVQDYCVSERNPNYRYRDLNSGPLPINGREATYEDPFPTDDRCPVGVERARIVYTIFDDRIVEHIVARNGGQAMWRVRQTCLYMEEHTYHRIP